MLAPLAFNLVGQYCVQISEWDRDDGRPPSAVALKHQSHWLPQRKDTPYPNDVGLEARAARDCYGEANDSAETSLDYATDSVQSVPSRGGWVSHFGVQSDLERCVL